MKYNHVTEEFSCFFIFPPDKFVLDVLLHSSQNAKNIRRVFTFLYSKLSCYVIGHI